MTELESYRNTEMLGLLCGPMVGYPNNNYDAFNEAAATLRRDGLDIVNPTEIYGGDDGLPREVYLRATIRTLMSSFYVVVLPGFENSSGALLEVATARAFGLPVFAYETRQELTLDGPYGYNGILFVADGLDASEDEPVEAHECQHCYEHEDGDDAVCHPCRDQLLGDEDAGLDDEPQGRFTEILDELRDLHNAKSHDYADEDAYSNFRRAERFGVSPFVGCLIRMSDKFERITQLSNHPPAVKDESIIDTLRDLAVYAVIASILREEESAKFWRETHAAMDQVVKNDEDCPF
jgi:hypothetical protein